MSGVRGWDVSLWKEGRRYQDSSRHNGCASTEVRKINYSFHKHELHIHHVPGNVPFQGLEMKLYFKFLFVVLTCLSLFPTLS